MKIIKIYLDKNTSTTIHGSIYGLDYVIEEEGYYTKIFLDTYNQRVEVIDYEGKDIDGLTTRLDYLAQKNNFGKVYLKAKSDDWEKFLTHGYILEGIFKHYYNGDNAYSLAKFFSKERRISEGFEKENEIIEEVAKIEPEVEFNSNLPNTYNIRPATKEDIPELIALYDRVFETYPIPLNQPLYLEKLMDSDVYFMVITNGGKIVSAASADMSKRYKNAEITDCATHPDERGNGLMSVIINALENEMKDMGIICLYSIARSLSFGMNTVFKKHNYTYTGRLINNCNIFGKFEDMNVWIKKI
ncbi:putative beta-lysine N-acetyltransferase [Alkalicella caledoniensis]|uniref:Putative beta-lysine N-acetyltransferase n=1 Tax=Alkalicella caledoniensis TaxID=2731377 RepID=A0A7G9W8I1_ALKCA|nr:putative beta-lysine N-acetyltransferase [Alkalicella caledoniensis]QNO14993.1 putative beta-lysine N-acetyltransferase [Alkalicella caledoniensis]